jgi:hypothetical protein
MGELLDSCDAYPVARTLKEESCCGRPSKTSRGCVGPWLVRCATGAGDHLVSHVSAGVGRQRLSRVTVRAGPRSNPGMGHAAVLAEVAEIAPSEAQARLDEAAQAA